MFSICMSNTNQNDPILKNAKKMIVCLLAFDSKTKLLNAPYCTQKYVLTHLALDICYVVNDTLPFLYLGRNSVMQILRSNN